MVSSQNGRTDRSSSSPIDAWLKKSDDCDRPACEETQSALARALSRIQSTKTKQNTKIDCPPAKDQIGNSSWTLLHSMAAWYPETPTGKEEEQMKQFMEALSIFYPCTYCAADFKSNLQQNPPKTKSREELSVWLCEQHNYVNEKLGKKIFDCNLQKLDSRWRKSNEPSCQK